MKMLRNSQSVRGPAQCKSDPGNNMVSRRIEWSRKQFIRNTNTCKTNTHKTKITVSLFTPGSTDEPEGFLIQGASRLVTWQFENLEKTIYYAITIYHHFTGFYAKNYLKKKKLAREMLIEQIIEFELMEQGSLGGTCTPKLVILMTTQKFLQGDLRVDYYLLLKYCRRQCILLEYICWRINAFTPLHSHNLKN